MRPLNRQDAASCGVPRLRLDVTLSLAVQVAELVAQPRKVLLHDRLTDFLKIALKTVSECWLGPSFIRSTARL